MAIGDFRFGIWDLELLSSQIRLVAATGGAASMWPTILICRTPVDQVGSIDTSSPQFFQSRPRSSGGSIDATIAIEAGPRQARSCFRREMTHIAFLLTLNAPAKPSLWR